MIGSLFIRFFLINAHNNLKFFLGDQMSISSIQGHGGHFARRGKNCQYCEIDSTVNQAVFFEIVGGLLFRRVYDDVEGEVQLRWT